MKLARPALPSAGPLSPRPLPLRRSPLIYILILFLIGHALADYPFQGDFLARGKNPNTAMPGIPWQGAMAAHATIHAGLVFLVAIASLCAVIWLNVGDVRGYFLGAVRISALLALGEFWAHASIDWLKCTRRIGFVADQGLHGGCKALWTLVVAFASGAPIA